VKKLLEKRVKRGSILLLRNCYVKSFNERPQISLAYNGSFILNPKNISFEELPEAKSELSKISQLAEEMNNVNVNARLLRKFPATQFEREGRQGKVMNFLIGDETGLVRATAWNDLVDQAQNLKENQAVGIEGAYTKPGLKGIELHLGWQARLVTGLEADIPSVAELLLDKAEKKRIVDLGEGDSNVLVEGKIVLVNQGALYYSVCPKCSGKLQRLDEGTVCDKCGEVKEPDIRPVISVRIDDGSAQINTVAYGKEAEKIVGMEKEELRKQAEERGRDALLEELQAMAGKQIRAVGRVKQNSFSNELELSANIVELR
jgi:ssDNA-binding replication factor A large subunit